MEDINSKVGHYRVINKMTSNAVSDFRSNQYSMKTDVSLSQQPTDNAPFEDGTPSFHKDLPHKKNIRQISSQVKYLKYSIGKNPNTPQTI